MAALAPATKCCTCLFRRVGWRERALVGRALGQGKQTGDQPHNLPCAGAQRNEKKGAAQGCSRRGAGLARQAPGWAQATYHRANVATTLAQGLQRCQPRQLPRCGKFLHCAARPSTATGTTRMCPVQPTGTRRRWLHARPWVVAAWASVQMVACRRGRCSRKSWRKSSRQAVPDLAVGSKQGHAHDTGKGVQVLRRVPGTAPAYDPTTHR